VRLAQLGFAAMGLTMVGCPLLVDNQLEVVPDVATSAGSPPTTDGGAPSEDGAPTPHGGVPNEGGAPSEDGPVACGVLSTAAPGEACPALCDRCEEGYCIFECSDDEVCQDRPLDCPAGWACRVGCSAQASCNKARINCPADFACEVQCLEVDSCKEAVVTCATGNCHVRCDVDKACEKTKVSCSTGHCAAECLAPMHPPMLACGAACACEPC
jgi:hypothetical protein